MHQCLTSNKGNEILQDNEFKHANNRSSFQSLVWSIMTTRRTFSKSLALSKKAWMHRDTSVGPCRSLHRIIYVASCPKSWSISSCECPLLRQFRAAARTVRLPTKELKERIIGEFLHSLQVLSLWIFTCKSRRIAPCSFSRVRECEINSMEAFESLGRSGGEIWKITCHPCAMIALMWSLGRMKLPKSLLLMASCLGKQNLDWSIPSVTIVTTGASWSLESALSFQYTNLSQYWWRKCLW